jgi:hypothetical protein
MMSLSRSLSKVIKMQHNARHKLTLAMGLIFLISTPCNADWIGDARPLMGTEPIDFFPA